ncbi:GxxExxY protein [Algoriphagus persicinus]|uniref:GxxExxY protein n=1 Tax=Algoriphagus persicinus TaxID=3108754 RepID=UPI002B397262|nr:GxxExxY protein [Algoriphagus sp. E1-3-M2]MEB2786476.1 GxxExxY protein [Algoriphagus sp. E1-3-M2]
MHENEISKIIVDIAFLIYKRLGPGLLESVYQAVFVYELKSKGLDVKTEIVIPVLWNDMKLDQGFRADIIVNNKVISELKSVEMLLPVHPKQLRTYLRLTGLRLGMLINFNEDKLTDGIKRVVNGLTDE